MNHLKRNWWKYYLGAGGAWVAVVMYNYPTSRSLPLAAKALLLWPLDVAQTYAQYGSLLPADT
jgi:hypothetical protein